MTAGRNTAAVQAMSRHDRLAALASLVGLAALAWVYLWWDAARMAEVAMPGGGVATAGAMDAPAASAWRVELLLSFMMWSVMMVGMMLPSAAPAILMYGSMVGKNRERRSALPAVWTFTAGYLAVWTGFSAVAAGLQAVLEATALLTPMMMSASRWLTGGLLVAAGIYQWLPVKQACLEKCRAPLPFFLFHWRPGLRGAFRMGAWHGTFCLGCCWALMLLLFTAGVMNLLWVALIAGFVIVEKLLPAGAVAGRLAGVGLAVAGGVTVVAGM